MQRLLLLFILAPSLIFGQSADSTKRKEDSFYADFVMGPYLMVDHNLYKSVFLTGARIGYECKTRFAFQIEYMVGNQEDETGQIGTTHTANGHIAYYFSEPNKNRVRPYVYLGGGFFEFKDFSKDVLGVAWNTGAGSEFNFSPKIKGFIEGRYVNLGWLNLEGRNELGVLWGVRARF